MTITLSNNGPNIYSGSQIRYNLEYYLDRFSGTYEEQGYTHHYDTIYTATSYNFLYTGVKLDDPDVGESDNYLSFTGSTWDTPYSLGFIPSYVSSWDDGAIVGGSSDAYTLEGIRAYAVNSFSQNIVTQFAVGRDNYWDAIGNMTSISGPAGDNYRVGTGDDLGLWTGFVWDYTTTMTAIASYRGGDYTPLTNLMNGEVFDLQGSIGQDIFYSYDQADTLRGGGGNDTLGGGGGNDQIEGGADNDTLSGDAGDDVLNGGAGDDTMNGGANNDLMLGGAGTNLLNGGDGDDTYELDTASTFDTIEDSAGYDTVRFYESSSFDWVSISFLGAGGRSYIDPGSIERFIGSESADVIRVPIGQTSGVRLDGYGGADVLGGGANADTIYGGDGNDTIYGEQGGDTLFGEYGDDTVWSGWGADTIYGGENNDLLGGEGDDDSLYGEGGVDTLYGGGGNDSLNGGAGGDAMYGEAGNDVMAGGADNDQMWGGADADDMTGDAGADQMWGGDGADRMLGGVGNDTLTGDGGDDALTGGVGDDALIGGSGRDTAYFDDHAGNISGSWVIRFPEGTAKTSSSINVGGFLALVTETDTLSGIEGVVLGGGDDTIYEAGGNTVTAGGGVDTLWLAPQVSTIGGMIDANQTVDMAAGTSSMWSSSNAGGLLLFYNIVTNFSGVEKLHANAGDDIVYGSANADVIYGDAGADVLEGRLGDDVLDGGAGVDTASYSQATAGVTVNLLATAAQNTGVTGRDTLVGIENVTGSAFGDVLLGDGGANALAGGSGQDVLRGGAGDDRLDGGDGVDTATYSEAAAGVTVNLSLTAAQNTGVTGRDTLVSIENVIGSAFNDILVGGSGANVLTGGGGADVLRGGLGADRLDGGAGVDTASYAGATGGVTVRLDVAGAQNTGADGLDTLVAIENLGGSVYADTLVGSAASNALSGGAGGDVLRGGGGADVLSGGSGSDTFYYALVSDSTSAAADVIRDFTLGDVIHLTSIDANTATLGDDPFVRVNAFTGVPGQLVFTPASASNGNMGVLMGDVNGDSTADLVIRLQGVTALATSSLRL